MGRVIDADDLERKLMLLPDDELCEDCCYAIVNVIAEMATEKPEARLLMEDEVRQLQKHTDMWIEMSAAEGHPTKVSATTLFGVGLRGILFGEGSTVDFDRYNRMPYGWRVWTARPTDRQREETLWESTAE